MTDLQTFLLAFAAFWGGVAVYVGRLMRLAARRKG